MKIAAVISEFNPFHNGHKYLLETIKKDYAVDYVIAIMSGDFVQRGEPALIPKHLRAKAAVAAGFDAVFELPVNYAISSASLFAFGGVSIINSLTAVDYIFFGSECGDISLLNKVADILLKEPEEFKTALKNHLATGLSYPKALRLSMDVIDPSLSPLLDGANNTLGIEYLKAIKFLNCKATPVTLKRIGTAHDSKETTDVEHSVSYSSASNIRSLIKSQYSYEKYLPVETLPVIKAFIDGLVTTYKTHNPLLKPLSSTDIDNYSLVLFNKLSTLTLDELMNYPESCRDLANIIYNNRNDFIFAHDLIDACTRKQYTHARVSRLVLQIILDVKTSALINNALEDSNENKEEAYNKTSSNLPYYVKPAYVRLLAFNRETTQGLRILNDSSNIPIITKPADFINDTDNNEIISSFQHDLRCSDFYNHGIILKNPDFSLVSDIKHSPEII